MTARTFDALVVGAGPAGSAAACALARAGLGVLVLDRARFPRSKPCAEYVSPAATRLLSDLGVLGAVHAAGAVPLSGMRVRAPDGTLLTGEWAAAREFRGAMTHGLALRRERLDALLVDAARASGATVREGVRVHGVLRDGHARVTGVSTVDAGDFRARLVIGADGLRSVVARRLFPDSRARWPQRMAFVAHYAGVGGPRALGEMHVEHDGYVGLAPVDGGLTNVAAVVPASIARQAAGDATAFLEGWLARRAHLRDRFAGAMRVGPARSVGPFGWRAQRATAPGAALVGDAADFLDPFTGEGVFSALRGAELLAPFAIESLGARSAGAATRALRGYEAARRRAFQGKWLVERIVAAVVGSAPAMNRVARGLARRRDLADTLVGVTGDVVPASAVLSPAYAWSLARAAFAGAS